VLAEVRTVAKFRLADDLDPILAPDAPNFSESADDSVHRHTILPPCV
jgi:hypothetical protein